MKEFVTKLSARKGSSKDYRIFNCIDVGKYSLSIQASSTHYCTPRELLSPEFYSSKEMAIFKEDGWIAITKSSIFRAFPRFNELMSRADGHFSNGDNSGRVVFGYVPVDLIEDLYQYLKS